MPTICPSLCSRTPPTNSAPTQGYCQSLRNLVSRVWNAVTSPFKAILRFLLCGKVFRPVQAAPLILPAPAPLPAPVILPPPPQVIPRPVVLPPAAAPVANLAPILTAPPPALRPSAKPPRAPVGPTPARPSRRSESCRATGNTLGQQFLERSTGKKPLPASQSTPKAVPPKARRQLETELFGPTPERLPHAAQLLGELALATPSLEDLTASRFLVGPEFPPGCDQKKAAIFVGIVGLMLAYGRVLEGEEIFADMMEAGLAFYQTIAEKISGPLPFVSADPDAMSLLRIIDLALSCCTFTKAPLYMEAQFPEDQSKCCYKGEMGEILNNLEQLYRKTRTPRGAVLLRGDLDNGPEVYIFIRQEKFCLLDLQYEGGIAWYECKDQGAFLAEADPKFLESEAVVIPLIPAKG